MAYMKERGYTLLNWSPFRLKVFLEHFKNLLYYLNGPIFSGIVFNEFEQKFKLPLKK